MTSLSLTSKLALLLPIVVKESEYEVLAFTDLCVSRVLKQRLVKLRISGSNVYHRIKSHEDI